MLVGVDGRDVRCLSMHYAVDSTHGRDKDMNNMQKAFYSLVESEIKRFADLFSDVLKVKLRGEDSDRWASVEYVYAPNVEVCVYLPKRNKSHTGEWLVTHSGSEHASPFAQVSLLDALIYSRDIADRVSRAPKKR